VLYSYTELEKNVIMHVQQKNKKEFFFMTIYGYARCSTNENKQDIDRQIMELKAMGANDETIHKEYISGSVTHDTELETVFNLMQEGDILVSTEPSRLTRSIEHLTSIIKQVQEKRIILKMGNFNFDCTKELDPLNEAMILMMGTFSQLDRKLIIERTKSGIANAHAKGVVFGRPKITYSNLPRKAVEYYEKYQAKEINKSQYARLCEVTPKTIRRYIAIIEAEAALGGSLVEDVAKGEKEKNEN
jgi:DNA invertase Pin-like site-specific DNA recombinase